MKMDETWRFTTSVHIAVSNYSAVAGLHIMTVLIRNGLIPKPAWPLS